MKNFTMEILFKDYNKKTIYCFKAETERCQAWGASELEAINNLIKAEAFEKSLNY